MRLTSLRAYTLPPPVPKMPPGLVELMDGMAREVLLYNPTNIYEFCANHMEKLLEIRDGPSSKKSLTLEQKILKAQEKVRQRAKERQVRFDKEIRNNRKLNEPIEKTDSPIILEDSVVPNLRATVHHIHDLEHATEIEISQESPADNAPVALLSELTEISHEKAPVVTNEKPEKDLGTESISGNLEIMLDKKRDGETSSEILTVSDKRSDVESIAVRVDTMPAESAAEEEIAESKEIFLVRKPDDESISANLSTMLENEHDDKHSREIIPENVVKISEEKHDEPFSANDETMSDKNKDEDIFFGKVEKEVLDGALLNKSEEIVGIENAIEGQLHTITEVSDENVVNESNITHAAVLPKITIGSQHDDYETKYTAEELFQDDIEQEQIHKENTVVISDEHGMENQNLSGNILGVSESCKSTENELNPLKSNGSDSEDNNNRQKDVTNTISLNTEKDDRNNVTETGEIKSVPISTSVVKKDDNVQQDKNIDDTSIEAIKNKDGLNSDIAMTDVLDIKTATDSDEILTESEKEKEEKSLVKKDTKEEVDTKDEISNITDIQNVVIESDEVPHKLETNEADVNNVYDQIDDNSRDVLLQKSDSTENTNEDSISIVESDLSKTDEDSSQNNPNMDLETAAVTIQKVFRSFMFKSRNSTFEDSTNEEHNSLDEENDKKDEYYAAANLNKERRPLGITRMDTVLQTVNEEKSLSLSTDDSSTLSSAATTIQAHVRGFLVRNRLNSSKTYSMNSLVNSHEVFDTDSEQQKSKTVLNIHIVPEDRNYLSRDESLITSMDLSMDGSPPSSVNLHPLSCDTSERRKMLKREDAVQSVTPPSNNSGKLSEDSVKEVLINENGVLEKESTDDITTEIEGQPKDVVGNETSDNTSSNTTVTPTTIITISKSEELIGSPRENIEAALRHNGRSLTKMSSDESDVITPFIPSPRSSVEVTKLAHSGEFHDVVLPTKVSRNDTSVVRGE